MNFLWLLWFVGCASTTAHITRLPPCSLPVVQLDRVWFQTVLNTDKEQCAQLCDQREDCKSAQHLARLQGCHLFKFNIRALVPPPPYPQTRCTDVTSFAKESCDFSKPVPTQPCSENTFGDTFIPDPAVVKHLLNYSNATTFETVPAPSLPVTGLCRASEKPSVVQVECLGSGAACNPTVKCLEACMKESDTCRAVSITRNVNNSTATVCELHAEQVESAVVPIQTNPVQQHSICLRVVRDKLPPPPKRRLSSQATSQGPKFPLVGAQRRALQPNFEDPQFALGAQRREWDLQQCALAIERDPACHQTTMIYSPFEYCGCLLLREGGPQPPDPTSQSFLCDLDQQQQLNSFQGSIRTSSVQVRFRAGSCGLDPTDTPTPQQPSSVSPTPSPTAPKESAGEDGDNKPDMVLLTVAPSLGFLGLICVYANWARYREYRNNEDSAYGTDRQVSCFVYCFHETVSAIARFCRCERSTARLYDSFAWRSSFMSSTKNDLYPDADAVSPKFTGYESPTSTGTSRTPDSRELQDLPSNWAVLVDGTSGKVKYQEKRTGKVISMPPTLQQYQHYLRHPSSIPSRDEGDNRPASQRDLEGQQQPPSLQNKTSRVSGLMKSLRSFMGHSFMSV